MDVLIIYKGWDSLDKEKDAVAVNMLNAFISQVDAQTGKKISEDAGLMLIAYATNIIASLSQE